MNPKTNPNLRSIPTADSVEVVEPEVTPGESLREKLLKELGRFSLICGVAVAGASLTGCDDDEWYKEIRLVDCNGDNRIDTRDKGCQDKAKADNDNDNSGSSSWDNHYNVIEYPNWADVSNW